MKYFIPGICGAIAVIVFASLGNTDGWMPDHPNNYLGKNNICALFYVFVYFDVQIFKYIVLYRNNKIYRSYIDFQGGRSV